MNWETLYCPHRDCQWYGKPFTVERLVKNGNSCSEPQARCNACGGRVALSYGTAYYGLKADRALFERAVRALAEGNALRATARIVQVDKDTVCAWLDRVARHSRVVMLSLWHNLHVWACQLDELWGSSTPKRRLPGAKLYCATYGDAWVWMAFAPVWRLVLAFVIGKRDQANADLLLARVAHVTDNHIPFFTSDHSRFAHFLDQLQTLPNNSLIFGTLVQPDGHSTAHGWVHGAEEAKSRRTVNFKKLRDFNRLTNVENRRKNERTVSDQLPKYKNALLTTYGEWYQPARQGTRGAYPNPRRRPLPALLYAQVVKKRAKGRVVEVDTHVVFGTQEAVAAYLGLRQSVRR